MIGDGCLSRCLASQVADSRGPTQSLQVALTRREAVRWLAWVLCTLERVTLGLPSLGVMVAVGNHFANCSFPLWVELSMFGCMVSKPVTITQTRIKGRIRCAGQGTAFLRWPLPVRSRCSVRCAATRSTRCVWAPGGREAPGLQLVTPAPGTCAAGAWSALSRASVRP